MIKKYQQIIASWRRYIDIEKLCNVQIDAKNISDGQHLVLSQDLFKEDSNIIGIQINEKLLQYFTGIRNNSADTKVIVGFAPVELTQKQIVKYVPLFVFSIQKNFADLLSVPIDTTHDNQKEIFPWIEINFHAESEYFTSALAFKEYFGIDPDDIPVNLPLATLMKNLSGSKGTWFDEIFNDFIAWANKSILGNKTYRRMSQYNGFVLNDYENSSSKLIDEQLDKLIAKEYIPDSATAAHAYLFGIDSGNTEAYNLQDDTIWKGSFHSYPIAKGQATILQKIQKQENLIACQGAPGTGKTTLLMAVIAGAITIRAKALLDGKDINNLTLIVSTANKAVQNAARELEGTAEFNTNNSFYFIGGKKDNLDKSFERVAKYKEWLSAQIYDQTKHKQIGQKIAKIHKVLEGRQQSYRQKLSEFELTRNNFKAFIGTNPDLETKLAIVSSSHSEQTDFLSPFGINKQNVHDTLNIFNTWSRTLETSKHFNKNNIGEIENLGNHTNKEFINALSTCCVAIEEINFIIDFFTKRKRVIAKKFAISNRDTFTAFSIDWQSIDERSIANAMDIIEKITKEADLLHSGRPNGFFFDNAINEPVKVLKTFVDTYKEKISLEDKIESKKTLLTIATAAEQAVSKYGDFINNYRLKQFKINQKLYRLSKEYIELESIKQKNDLLKALGWWQDIATGYGYKQNKAVSAAVKMGVERYFGLISMAYPIHTSSIHASPGIFRQFFQKSEDKLKGFKPIYLLFSDESGMSLPHLAYPVIYQSEKVIAVGDPKQLPPVVTVDASIGILFEKEFYSDETDRSKYSPTRTSLYHRAAKCASGDFKDIGDGVILDEHRRCQSDIANLFVDIAEYTGMVVCTSEMSGQDVEKLDKIGGKNLLFYDVPGKAGQKRNTNIDEVFAISSIIDKLQESGYNVKSDIGIITPYATQEALLIEKLGGRLGHTSEASKIGTVHKFQGVEFNVVIFSPVIHKETDSSSFINSSPNLLNVAVSRAKHLFITAGNYDRLMSAGGYLSKICAHCKQHGYILSIEHQYDEKEPALSIEQTESNLLHSCEHLDWFSTSVNEAKQHIMITSPWITLKNIEFTLPLLQSAISRGVTIDIIYGYNKDDFGDTEAITRLIAAGCKLSLNPQSTHSKVLIIDHELLCVGSFNWLSQTHHLYCKEEYFSKINIRDEISMWVKDSVRAAEALNLLNHGAAITFNSKKSGPMTEELPLCIKCSSKITEKVYSFSMAKFNQPICFACQKEEK